MNKPILLLDIDGVLAPWPGKLGFDQDVFWHHEAANVHLRRDLPDLIHRLGEICELHWGTAWERQANLYMLEHMGLSTPLPFIEFSNYTGLEGAIEAIEEEDGIYHRWQGEQAPESWKLPWIKRFCREHADRPIAWIDDEANTDTMEFAAEREVPTLFLRPDGSKGMDENHIEKIEEWISTEVKSWEERQKEISEGA